jgi:hypothetical protein
MITTTREFNTYSEAVAAFDKAREAYEIGYGFYPKRLRRPAEQDETGKEVRHLYIGALSTEHPFGFTYQRGESCD